MAGTFFMQEITIMIRDLVYKNRSYRRFYENEAVGKETLAELVDLARVSATGRNLQALKFLVSNDRENNAKIFATLAWAGYLKEWDGPEEGERPSAYIVILEDTSIGTSMAYDHGIASQSMLLGAVEKGLGGCIIVSVKKTELVNALNLPMHFNVIAVIALGKPKEEVVIEDLAKNGDVKYWRDENQVHHVPKRKLEDILLTL